MTRDEEIAHLAKRIATLQALVETHERSIIEYERKREQAKGRLKACYKRRSELNNLELNFNLPTTEN